MVFNERRFFVWAMKRMLTATFVTATFVLVLLLVKNVNIPQYSDFDPITENVKDPT